MKMDVDLDYFCWDNTMSTGEPKRIKITEEAYRSFTDDRNHPLRILATRIVDAVEDQGRYWLYISQVIPEEPLPDDETILRRMDRLFWYLRRTGVRPAAIDICRSVRSGRRSETC